MKKIISRSLFVLMCLFMIVSSVLAEGTAGTGTGDIGGSDTSVSTGSLSANNLYDENFVIGVRVTFHTSSGGEISGQNFVVPAQATRGAYVANSSSKISSSAGGWSYVSSFTLTRELTNIFTKNGFSINIDSILRGGNLSKDVLFSGLLGSATEEKAKKFFESFGINVDNYYNKEKDSYDLFLVWEPLGLINYNGKRYIGTAYELSNFVDGLNTDRKEQYCFGANKCTKDPYKAVGTAITVNMGCAVNLDDSDEFGIKVAEKYPDSFSARSYFGGNLDASTASDVQKYCSGSGNAARDNLKQYALDSNSALGIGVVWFDEFRDPKLTCESIAKYFDTTNENMCENPNKYNYTSLNNHANKNKIKYPAGTNEITAEWYKENCCVEPPTSDYSCYVDYSVPNCSDSGVKYSDPSSEEEWENCVFNDSSNYNISTHKWSSKGSGLTYYEDGLSKDYCEVYCVEEVDAYFDSENPTVLAGYHFQWGWSTVSTSRTCKTKEIKWNDFRTDLDLANEAVVQQLAENKLYEKNKGGSWVAVEDVYGKTCVEWGSGEGASITENCTNIVENGGNVQDNCANFFEDKVKEGASCSCDSTGVSPDGREHSFECTCTYPDSEPSCVREDSVYLHTIYNYVGGSSSESVTVAGITKTATTSLTTTAHKNNPPIGNPAPGGNVEAAVYKVNSIIEEMRGCYNFNDSNVLNEQTSAVISYINDTYSYSGDMEKSSSSSYSGSGELIEDVNLTALTSCSGTTCSVTKQPMKHYEYYQKQGWSESVFTIEDGIYQYVLKNPTGLTLSSIHSWELDAYKGGTVINNWIDIGYSNFPVSYQSGNQTYSGGLNIEYQNLGHSKSNSAKTEVDRILETVSTDGTEYHMWSCDYNVNAELVTESGINLIYREIDLETPFPDIDASNRNTGSNWCDGKDCAWNNSISKAYILNNRNVKNDAVYDLEPMYTFIMTPSDIIKIRNYNEENTYGALTGTYAGETYNFICTTGTGRGCRSEYLEELMKLMDSAEYPGTCKDDRTVYNNVAQFDYCRY